jgi:hypothetical protein
MAVRGSNQPANAGDEVSRLLKALVEQTSSYGSEEGEGS